MTHLTSRLSRNSGPIKKPDVVELGISLGLLEHCQRTCLPDTPSEKFPTPPGRPKLPQVVFFNELGGGWSPRPKRWRTAERMGWGWS